MFLHLLDSSFACFAVILYKFACRLFKRTTCVCSTPFSTSALCLYRTPYIE